MEYTVLSLKPELLDEISTLLYNQNAHLYKGLINIGSRDELKEYISKYYMDGNKVYPFAVVMIDPDLNDKFIGIAFIVYNNTLANATGIWINDVYIIPEYRGIGLGAALIETVKHTLANKLNVKEVYLWVDSPNLTRFYKDLGFEIIIPQKKYEQFTFNVMKAELTPVEPSLIQPVHVTGLIVIILIIILFKTILRFFYNLLFNWKMKTS